MVWVAHGKLMVLQFDEEDQDFGEEFLSERDPSILHFLLASGDEGRGRVCSIVAQAIMLSACVC